jgi:oligopeptide/dipeptide ABC transporter ATP-binding protein
MENTPIIQLKNVTKIFGGRKNPTYALRDMSLALDANTPSIVTIAGESGSGKTTMGMLILGFYSPTFGQVLYNGKSLTELNRDEMFQYRREIQAVFQDPFAVYNPFYLVDNLLSIPIKNFKLASSKAESRELQEEALEAVGLRPEETLGRYPHQLSGGQRQRIAVARALLLKPKLLVTDEPVSMVDASLRSTILKALRNLNRDSNVPIFYITHDLTTAYHISDYIIILYRGSAMEAGNVDKIIREPKHPYTQLLVGSIPWPDPNLKWGEAEKISGQTQAMFQGIKGCQFAPRCKYVHDICHTAPPELFLHEEDRAVACYLYKDADVLTRENLGTLFKAVV